MSGAQTYVRHNVFFKLILAKISAEICMSDSDVYFLYNFFTSIQNNEVIFVLKHSLRDANETTAQFIIRLSIGWHWITFLIFFFN